MLPARYNTLGGEGCPARDVREAAKNRKYCKVAMQEPCRFMPERVGNMQKD